MPHSSIYTLYRLETLGGSLPDRWEIFLKCRCNYSWAPNRW